MSKFFDWFNKDKKTSTPEVTETPEVRPEDTKSDERSESANNTNAESSAGSDEKAVAESLDESLDKSVDKSTLEPIAEASSESVSKPAAKPTAEISEEKADVLQQQVTPTEPAPVESEPTEQSTEVQSDKKPKFFERLKAGLSRTKQNIGTGFVALFKGKSIDDDLYEELETQLLVADVGMDTTAKIIDSLTEKAKLSQLKDGEALYGLLKTQLHGMLDNVDKPLNIESEQGPFVILMVGVNGVGKTTTIGKMAKQFQQQGKSVMLAAGDTFRAAAVEQLEVWGERNNIPVVAQHTGADSASVLFDALQSAKAKNVDVLIADTAGRLQNKDNLMEELKKVVRVMKKVDPNAPHEVMLTVDAGTGQNAISQAKLFNDAVGVTGITLTKLDGTAKGGVIFAVADQLDLPIRYIGVGEGIDDLRQFDSDDFIQALFSDSNAETNAS